MKHLVGQLGERFGVDLVRRAEYSLPPTINTRNVIEVHRMYKPGSRMVCCICSSRTNARLVMKNMEKNTTLCKA